MLDILNTFIINKKELEQLVNESIEDIAKDYIKEITELQTLLEINSNRYQELEFKYNSLLQENDILRAKIKAPKKNKGNSEFETLASQILGEEYE